MLVINVEDNGEGIDQEKLVYINNYIANGVNPKEIHKIRVGLGLININERIKMIYNTKFGLKVYSMKGVGTNVELIIPKSID
jgi:two-component system sensor histidine kinase YesM